MSKISFIILCIILLCIILLCIILIGIILNTRTETTICNKQLTDTEYINHMITHHQVAVDMSEIQLHTTKNPVILAV